MVSDLYSLMTAASASNGDELCFTQYTADPALRQHVCRFSPSLMFTVITSSKFAGEDALQKFLEVPLFLLSMSGWPQM